MSNICLNKKSIVNLGIEHISYILQPLAFDCEPLYLLGLLIFVHSVLWLTEHMCTGKNDSMIEIIS